ncbi:MAG: hypothetical protein QGG36_11195 [Pirellulaceae bacterium]|jgi:hypothetical protein|nr:hypothetical protein [Pirellulaceae bacterium]
MPQFILLDHSLTSLGGHHYEYAIQILRAARSAGFDLVLGCGDELSDWSEFPSARVFPVFGHTTYSRCGTMNHQRAPLRRLDAVRNPFPGRPLASLAGFVRHSGELIQDIKRRVAGPRERSSFVAACRKVFEQIDVSADDHIFVPTASEFDLGSLAEFLTEADPAVRGAHWHVQFHLNFCEGREPTFANQRPRTAYLRGQVGAAAKRIGDVDTRFYVTTDQLREQYRLLDLPNLQSLPYPANPNCRPTPATGRDRLRVVCAGRPRAEKGSRLLQTMIDAIWTEYLETNRVQLIVQAAPNSLSLRLPDGRTPATLNEQFEADSAVAFAAYPLDVEAYAGLLQCADIGLFLYDADEYYARCSGVLVEMLACGKPVITPAACWLDEQMRDVNRAYVRKVIEDSSRELVALAARRECSLQIPNGATMLSVTIDPSGRPGRYWEVVVHQRDQRGMVTTSDTRVLGDERGDAALFSRRGRSVTAVCQISPLDETGESAPPISGHWLRRERPTPLGAIGQAADASHVAEALRDVVDHFPHYQSSAVGFANSWRRRHAPMRTIEQLTGGAVAASRAA